jgi:hypothetical protein
MSQSNINLNSPGVDPGASIHYRKINAGGQTLKTILFITLTSLIFLSCKQEGLSEQQALNMLKAELSLPATLDYDVFYSDPNHVEKMLSSDLAENKWISVEETLRVSGKSFIKFTRKSKPYLLPTPKEYLKLDIQKVKIAEMDLDRIISIHYHGDGKLAEVEFTTRLQKVSPFSVLAKIDLTDRKHQKAYFKFTDKTWKLIKT